MWQTISKIFGNKDLRNKIGYVLALLVVFRFAAHIPIPGVEIANLKAFFNSNAYLGLLNVFSGGALENFSLVMLGVGPYISASIIFQLLGMIVPKFEEMQKETDGQRQIQQWTRYLAVPMAVVQAYGTIILLQRTGGGLLGTLSNWQLITAIILLAGGSMFTMWLGELITEKKYWQRYLHYDLCRYRSPSASSATTIICYLRQFTVTHHSALYRFSYCDYL